MDPIDDLMSDHRLIEKVMAALEAKLADTGEFPAAFAEQALHFFVEYADRFHHFKEEETLFPVLAERGVPVEGGPIGVMLQEHALGRQLLSMIRENLTAARRGDEAAQEAVRTAARQYIALLRNHIWKEDQVLFMMARRVLDSGALREVESRFAEAPAEAVRRHREFGAGL